MQAAVAPAGGIANPASHGGRYGLVFCSGVIYVPETERMSHYFHTRLIEQFDAMIHFDDTRALEPLEPGAGWIREEVPETYPTGI